MSFIFPTVALSQNGLTLVMSGNSNYTSFSNPVVSGSGAAEIALQLSGTIVPEPASIALVLSGLGLLARRRLVRHRKDA